MADVFVSYAREDRARADQIAQALQAAGIDVFWDTEIPPGQTWADFIEAKLGQCKAVIVLWSETSTRSQWVREEARMARDRGKLIPVLLDASQMPFGFGEVQAANLSNWTGGDDHADWRRLMAAVRDALTRPAAPHPSQSAYAAQSAHTAPSQSMAAQPDQSPWGYIQKCLRLYLNGNGRARRAEYWWFVLFEIGVVFAAFLVDVTLSSSGGYEFPVVMAIAALALLGPAISVAIRRVHDIGVTGWVVLVVLIPYLGGLVMLVLALIPGNAQANQYGPSPKAA
jgi:uncharacterized membrane protein YhaH (DUF805 family)